MRATRTSAVAKASRHWREAALHIRGELRAHGVQGHLRRLDDYARGERGDGIARLIADYAAYCRDLGLPAASFAREIGNATADITADVWAEGAA